MIYTFYPLLDSAPLALKQQGVQPRAVLMSALQVRPSPGHPPPGFPNLSSPSPQSSQLLWTTRLTYHATRRGFFDFTSEDYRWLVFRDFVHKAPVLRSAPRLVLGVFNLLFIAIAQNVLLAMLGVSFPVVIHSPNQADASVLVGSCLRILLRRRLSRYIGAMPCSLG